MAYVFNTVTETHSGEALPSVPVTVRTKERAYLSSDRREVVRTSQVNTDSATKTGNGDDWRDPTEGLYVLDLDYLGDGNYHLIREPGQDEQSIVVPSTDPTEDDDHLIPGTGEGTEHTAVYGWWVHELLTVDPPQADAVSVQDVLRIDGTAQTINASNKAQVWENLGDLPHANLPTLVAADIPDLSADKVTSGTLGTDRIPSLPASKVTTGTFDAARIPSLTLSKISDAGTMAGEDKDDYVPQTDVETQGGVAASKIATHAVRLADIRRGKGGVIGTNGKPVVSFRIDHGIDDWLETFWPEFKSRGIPASLGVVTGAVGNADDDYEPTSTTYTELLAEAKKGFEVWAHSKTHQDPAVTGNTLDEEIVDPRATLENAGFRVIGWTQPGITPCDTPHYSTNFNGDTDWDTDVGQRYLGTYGLIEATGAIGGQMRHLPTHGNYDLGHYTLDSMSASTAEGLIDEAVLLGLSIELMFHPRFVAAGTVTATTQDIKDVLDYILNLWDDGKIEVLTCSGMAFADPTTDRRLDLMHDGSFASTSSIPSGAGIGTWGYAGGTGTGIEVKTDGGHTGDNYVHVPSSASFSYVYQGNALVQALRAQGHTFIAEAWARCTTADTSARLYVVEMNGTTQTNSYNGTYALTAGSGWTHLRLPVTLSLDTTNVQVRVNRGAGTGDLDFDDISLKAV